MEFKEVISEYHKMIYHISLGYLRNKEDAEDMVQEVFVKYVKYVKSGKSFDDKTHEKYWIIRTTMNSCCNSLRKISKKKKSNDEKEYIAPNNTLFDKIQGLRDIYKNIIILYYFEEINMQEISKILEISEENARIRLKRAIEILEKGLDIKE